MAPPRRINQPLAAGTGRPGSRASFDVRLAIHAAATRAQRRYDRSRSRRAVLGVLKAIPHSLIVLRSGCGWQRRTFVEPLYIENL